MKPGLQQEAQTETRRLEVVPSRPSLPTCFVGCSRLLPLLCFLAFPLTARADGIDVPIAIGYGVAIFVPLLLFNATIEAPIMGRFLGIQFSELWPSWFKANVWSLLGGIPALILNAALAGWFLPGELNRRFRAYPFFLLLFIFVFFTVTCLVEFFYTRRFVRKMEVQIGAGKLAKGVVLANLASYAVLAPVYFLLNSPRADLHAVPSAAQCSKRPGVSVVAIDPKGHLMATSVDGQRRRVVVPLEVRDYVVSADLTQVLYRGARDRFYFLNHGTNRLVPELGFWCLAPEMDFSPSGKYAAFLSTDMRGVRVFDFKSGNAKDVPTFGIGSFCRLVWSSREDTLYLRTGREDWEIVLEPVVSSRRLMNPPKSFAGHYGRVGNTWTREGVFYGYHQDGPLRLVLQRGWTSQLVVWKEKDRVLRLKDPARQLGIQQAVFFDGSGEILVEVGDFVYVLDVLSRRFATVMAGKDFIALTPPFSKHANL